MAEQPGTGRYPTPPSSGAWEGTEFSANDPDQGNFGANWQEGAGKSSVSKAGREEGQGIHVPKGGTGKTFSGESSTGDFEQAEMPPTGINYFDFKG